MCNTCHFALEAYNKAIEPYLNTYIRDTCITSVNLNDNANVVYNAAVGPYYEKFVKICRQCKDKQSKPT